MEKFVCNQCKRAGCPYRGRKGLCPKKATSILCEPSLLKQSTRLTQVACNGQNEYLRVDSSNTVLMKVENMYCVLIDNDVTMYNQSTPSSLPQALSMFKYSMQRQGNRDWPRGGASGYLGEDIHRLAHGDNAVDLAKAHGLQRDHQAETYNEKLCNTDYNHNPVEKNHHVRVEIRDAKQLDEFLDDIVKADNNSDGVYYDKHQKRKDNHGRKFVK